MHRADQAVNGVLNAIRSFTTCPHAGEAYIGGMNRLPSPQRAEPIRWRPAGPDLAADLRVSLPRRIWPLVQGRTRRESRRCSCPMDIWGFAMQRLLCPIAMTTGGATIRRANG